MTEEIRVPAPRLQHPIRLLLAASTVVTSALIWLLWTSEARSTAPSRGEGASATVYAGAIRTTVKVMSELHGHLQLRVHLKRGGRSLAARYVSLTVRPLPPLMAGRREFRLRPAAGTFAVDLPSPVSGAWETDVRLAPPLDAAHFLLRVSPNPRLVPSTIDPLLTPGEPVREVMLAWGAGTARLELAPGSLTQENTFRVQLQGQRRLPPTDPGAVCLIPVEQAAAGTHQETLRRANDGWSESHACAVSTARSVRAKASG